MNAGGEKYTLNVQLLILMNVLKTGVTGRHACISNSLLLMKCYRNLQNKLVQCTETGKVIEHN